MRIAVLGAGAWGSALAVSAADNALAAHRVTLWARDAAQAALLRTQRENARYLPGIALPSTLALTSTDVQAVAADADLVVVATPMAGLRDLLLQLRDCEAPVVWLCKGFEADTSNSHGLLGHEIAAQVAPDLRCGILSGPSFAQEVARGCPTALVAASVNAAVRDALVAAFHSASLRVYANDDILGVEVGGAVKNVLAIATGLCDGLNLGLNARAALITRGLAEMTRLGVALGARAETLTGLSGLGDLVLTATGDLSRNRQIGLALAHGQSLPQALAAIGHVAEGVRCAKAVAQRAGDAGIEMPIVQAVVALLEGSVKPQAAVARLMGRQAAGEYAKRT